jgi:phage repressor protein C with HTH and peptisase S24 domain
MDTLLAPLLFNVNRAAFGAGISGRHSLSVMRNSDSRRAKPTQADIEAARRLRQAWEAAKREDGTLTQESAAAELGINQSAVSQYLNGAIRLNYRVLLGFSKMLGIKPEQIRTDLPEQQMTNAVGEEPAIYSEWRDVLAHVQAASLGDGALPDEYAEAHRLKFRANSLRRQGLRADDLRVFYGRGDSMLPRVRDGDAVLFNTSQTTPDDGALFVVQRDGELFVKRCDIIDRTVYFRSDNPDGDHNWKKPKRMDDPVRPIEILGKVRWIGSWE